MTTAGHGGGAAETINNLLLSLARGASDGLTEKRAAVSGSGDATGEDRVAAANEAVRRRRRRCGARASPPGGGDRTVKVAAAWLARSGRRRGDESDDGGVVFRVGLGWLMNGGWVWRRGRVFRKGFLVFSRGELVCGWFSGCSPDSGHLLGLEISSESLCYAADHSRCL
ncbi:hypothetical protein Droror1_Dr00012032 [Drosera rotundifolia]